MSSDRPFRAGDVVWTKTSIWPRTILSINDGWANVSFLAFSEYVPLDQLEPIPKGPPCQNPTS